MNPTIFKPYVKSVTLLLLTTLFIIFACSLSSDLYAQESEEVNSVNNLISAGKAQLHKNDVLWCNEKRGCPSEDLLSIHDLGVQLLEHVDTSQHNLSTAYTYLYLGSLYSLLRYNIDSIDLEKYSYDLENLEYRLSTALDIFKKENKTEDALFAADMLCNHFMYNVSNNLNAKKYIEEFIALSSSSTPNINLARMYNYLGVIHHTRNKLFDAYKNYSTALHILVEQEDIRYKAKYLKVLDYNIGNILLELELVRESIPHLTRSLEYEKERKQDYLLDLVILAGAYLDLEDMNEFEPLHKELEEYSKKEDLSEFKQTLLNYYFTNYWIERDHIRAYSYLSYYDNISEERKTQFSSSGFQGWYLAHIFNNLHLYHIKNNDHKSAFKALNWAIKFADIGENVRAGIKFRRVLLDLYNKHGESSEIPKLERSISDISAQVLILEEKRQKESTLILRDILQQQAEFKELELTNNVNRQKAKSSIRFIILLVLLFSTLAYLLIYRLRKSKAEKELLSENNKLLKEVNDQLSEKHQILVKELRSKVLMLTNYNNLYQNITVTLNSEKIDKKITHLIKKVFRQHDHSDLVKDVESDYMMYNENLILRLNEIAPNLTQNNLKLCILLVMNLSPQEIAQIRGVSASSVRVAIKRLKVKLGLSSDENVHSFLLALDKKKAIA